MRFNAIVMCGAVVFGSMIGSTAMAQSPGGTQPRRPTTVRSGINRPRQSNPAPSRTSPSFGGTASGGIGLSGTGRGGAPQRQLRRNQTPVISPFLNLDSNFVASDAGQYFTKTLPQEEYNRTQQQTQRAFNSVQGEIGQQQIDIQSGLNTTGHATSFMNLGRYYSQQ